MDADFLPLFILYISPVGWSEGNGRRRRRRVRSAEFLPHQTTRGDDVKKTIHFPFSSFFFPELDGKWRPRSCGAVTYDLRTARCVFFLFYTGSREVAFKKKKGKKEESTLNLLIPFVYCCSVCGREENEEITEWMTAAACWVGVAVDRADVDAPADEASTSRCCFSRDIIIGTDPTAVGTSNNNNNEKKRDSILNNSTPSFGRGNSFPIIVWLCNTWLASWARLSCCRRSAAFSGFWHDHLSSYPAHFVFHYTREAAPHRWMRHDHRLLTSEAITKDFRDHRSSSWRNSNQNLYLLLTFSACDINFLQVLEYLISSFRCCLSLRNLRNEVGAYLLDRLCAALLLMSKNNITYYTRFLIFLQQS